MALYGVIWGFIGLYMGIYGVIWGYAGLRGVLPLDVRRAGAETNQASDPAITSPASTHTIARHLSYSLNSQYPS